MIKKSFVLILGVFCWALAEARGEECPKMEVENVVRYKGIVSESDGWTEKEDKTTKPTLMACKQWEVIDQQMICYYGSPKASYDYSVVKTIDDGVECERSRRECAFICEQKKEKRNLPPKQRISNKNLYRNN